MLFRFISVNLVDTDRRHVSNVVIITMLQHAIGRPLARLLVDRTVRIVHRYNDRLLLAGHTLFGCRFLRYHRTITRINGTGLRTEGPIVFHTTLLSAFHSLGAIVRRHQTRGVIRILFRRNISSVFSFS